MDNDKEKMMGGAVADKITSLVSDRAKPCVSKAIDYTLLVFLLLLQFMRCNPITPEEVYQQVQENTLNTTNVSSLYSCEFSGHSSLLYSSEDSYVNFLALATIIIGLCIGIVYAAFVWIHSSRQADDIPIHPWTQKLYQCTGKILVIDSALEIPISFYFAPVMTFILWTFFSLAIAGLIFLSVMYGNIVQGDENAKSVFSTNAALVALNLYQLTGEVSQYFVLYKASTSKETREKFDDEGHDPMSIGIHGRIFNVFAKHEQKIV